MERPYAWAMPTHKTFTLVGVRALLTRTIESVGGLWADPFAGDQRVHPAVITNDLDPRAASDFHDEAVDFLRRFSDESLGGVVFDPPYSPRQISECYKGIGRKVNYTDTQASFWSRCKREIARVVVPGGKVVTFAWNTNGIGASNGFYKLLTGNIAHGGWHNDTLITVERKQAFRCAVIPERLHSTLTCACEEEA